MFRLDPLKCDFVTHFFHHQESFWRIPAKLSSPQLRRAAAALCLSSEAPEEASQPENPTEEHQEETDSHEQRAQALRALLLARKRKPPSAEHTGGGIITIPHRDSGGNSKFQNFSIPHFQTEFCVKETTGTQAAQYSFFKIFI